MVIKRLDHPTLKLSYHIKKRYGYYVLLPSNKKFQRMSTKCDVRAFLIIAGSSQHLSGRVERRRWTDASVRQQPTRTNWTRLLIRSIFDFFCERISISIQRPRTISLTLCRVLVLRSAKPCTREKVATDKLALFCSVWD